MNFIAQKVVSYALNSRALTGEKPYSHAVNARLCKFQYSRTGATELIRHVRGTAFVTRYLLPGHSTSIVDGNCVCETLARRRKKTVQEISLNVANVFSFYAMIAIKHTFSMH